MNIKNMAIVLIGLALIINVTPSIADEIVIVGNEYKPPKVYMKDGEPKGILVDILKYVEKETEHSFKIKLYPWKRAYMIAEAGKGGIIGLSMTKKRLQILDYSQVMYYDDLMLVVLKGNEFPFQSIEDLAGKSVGIGRGASYGDEFERGRKEIFKVDEDSNTFHRLNKLLSRHIDVALVGRGKAGFNLVLKDDPELLQRKNEFSILAKPLKRDPNYLGFAKTMNMKKFLREFNEVLQKGYQDGTIQNIIDKYSE